MHLAVRARIYCRGLLGFVAVVVHGNDLWTSHCRRASPTTRQRTR
jgi:hypothetical protein